MLLDVNIIKLQINTMSTPVESKKVVYYKDEPEIEVINQIVDGYFAIIPLEDNKTMYVNEEGETQSLPINEEASKIAGQTVYGNVLIVG